MPTSVLHGTDQFNALEIVALRSEGEDPTYPGSGRWQRVGLVQDSMKLERESIPEAAEITPSGAVTIYESGPGRWKGTFTTLVYYNAKWFHHLMCQLHGGLEILTLDVLPNAVAAPGIGALKIVNTHSYLPQSFKAITTGSASAVPFGIGIRVWKMGNTDLDPTVMPNCHKIIGARVLECSMENTAGNWLQATWTIEGPVPTVENVEGTAPLARTANEYPVKPGDLQRDISHPILPSLAQVGQGPLIGGTKSIPSLEGVTIRMNNGLQFPSNLATAFDTALRPGHGKNWDVSLDINQAMDRLYTANSGYLAYNFFLKQFCWVRLRYISAPTGAVHSAQTPLADPAENVPYSLEILVPYCRATTSDTSIDGPGRLKDNTALKPYVYTIESDNVAMTADLLGLHLFQFAVSRLDEPAVDTLFNHTAEGGNGAHSTLTP